ncbi:MAG: Murein hydrolase activator NlpD [Holosporales bacterium]
MISLFSNHISYEIRKGYKMKKKLLNTVLSAVLLFGCAEKNQEVAEVIHARKPTPYYTVKEGDSVASVADKHGMTAQELIEENGLITPFELIPGQKIIVRHRAAKNNQENAFESDGIVVKKEEERKSGFDPAGFVKDDASLKKTDSSFEEDEKTPKVHEEETQVPLKNGGYVWPVKGKVIRKFGEKTGKEVSEGISIAAPEGTPVYPSAPGTVLRSNEEIAGFGKAIVIQHEDGKKSLYLHLKVCNAKVGQKVDVKTIIGRVGKSGGLKKPQLHFQIRDANKKAINPISVLGS